MAGCHIVMQYQGPLWKRDVLMELSRLHQGGDDSHSILLHLYVCIVNYTLILQASFLCKI